MMKCVLNHKLFFSISLLLAIESGHAYAQTFEELRGQGGTRTYTQTADHVLQSSSTSTGTFNIEGNLENALSLDADGNVILSSENASSGDKVYIFDGNQKRAVQNSGGIINVFNMYFTNGFSSLGGAFYNTTGDLNITNTSFYKNKITGSGGAISNGGDADIKNSSFIGNEASNNGGAISHGDSNLIITNSLFSNNKSSATSATYGGGAIGTRGTATISGTKFNNNQALQGGAIYLYTANKTTVTKSIFDANSATLGGAIYAKTNTYYQDTGSEYSYNTAKSSGGAIYSLNSIMLDDIEFKYNKVEFADTTSNLQGGAIRVQGTGVISNSIFVGNQVIATAADITAQGGAILNNANLTISDTIIKNSLAQSSAHVARGGAIENSSGAELAITNTTFENNAATSLGTAYGGAIYNVGTLYLNATDGKNTVFSGNTENSASNAINNNGGTVYFNSGSYSKIISYDGFSGGGAYNLQSGTLALWGANANFASGSNLNVTAGAKINTIDNEIRETTLGKLKLTGDIYYGIDVNVSNLTGDELDGSLVTGSTGEIIINEINVLGVSKDEEVEINITNTFSGIINLAINETITDGYDAILYEKSTGILTLKTSYTLNEAVIDTITDRSYNMGADEIVTRILGVMAGESLAINGNQNNITASNGADGMTMTTGQTISLNNIGTISGFVNSFINATGGDVNITNSDTSMTTTIKNSITGVDNLTISGSTDFINTTIEADSIILNTDIILSNSTISGNFSGDGEIKTDSATIKNSVVGVDIDGGAGTQLNIENSTISGKLNSAGGLFFSGTNIINQSFTVDSNVSNTGILNVNSDFALSGVLSGGGTLNFNNVNSVLTLSGSITDTTFNMGAGTLKTSGDGVDSYNIGNATLTNTKLDVDFYVNTDGTIDSDIFVGATNTSSAILEAITVNPATVATNIDGASGFIRIFEVGSDVAVSSGLSGDELLILTNTYTLGLTSATNGLNYTLTSETNTLEKVINLTTPAIRQYYMSANETAGISNLIGDLTIMGNGNTVTDGTITMQTDASLTLNNLSMGANIVGGTNTTVDIEGNVNYLDAATIKDTSIDLSANSTLKFANDTSFNDGTNSLNFNGGALSTANGITNDIMLDTLTLSRDANWSLDVDLENEKMDTLNAATVNGSGNFNITYMKLISDATKDITPINFTTNTDLMDKVSYTGVNPVAFSPTYKYDVTYDAGKFTFTRKTGGGSDDYNPSAFTGVVGSDASYLVISDIFDQVLINPNGLDVYRQFNNKSSGDEIKYSNVWSKTYGTDEDIEVENFEVENKTYGTVLGIDSKEYELANGGGALYSAYLAYVGSIQEYDTVDIMQNGLVIGARALFNHNNLFTGFTGNIGINYADATNMYGDEDFMMYSLGISNKTGASFEIEDGKYIIEPSMMLSYIHSYTPSYKNSAGLKTGANNLNVLQIRPELKFVANLSGYVPYMAFSYNWNVVDATRIRIEDASIPHLAIDPYAEVKIGSWKKFDEIFSGFIEIAYTRGGRKGFATQFGFKWEF